MKLLKIIAILAYIATLLSLGSCSTGESLTHNERKAQRKLRKAIAADPNIVAKQYTDTTISGVVDTTVAVIDSGFAGSTTGFDCDSLKQAVKRLRSDEGLYLHRDSLIDISVKEDKAGRLSVMYKVKDRIIYQPLRIPYEVKVSVPGKVITKYEKDEAYQHWWFWILLVIGIVLLYLLIRKKQKS